MVWRSFLAGVVTTLVAMAIALVIVVTVGRVVISSLFASIGPRPVATLSAARARGTNTPVPVGQWFEAKKDVRIRVMSLTVVDSYDYGHGQVLRPTGTGTHIYVLQVEGRFDGPAGESASLNGEHFRILNSQRQVAYPDTVNVDNTRTFRHIVYGGGSGTGEVIFMTDKIEGLYYQTDDFTVEPIFLAVPSQ